jgi:aminoglycoside 6'-N-acetyltransferase I
MDVAPLPDNRPVAFTITDLARTPSARCQAAQLLVDGFRDHWPNAWPTLGDAREEVRDMLRPGRLARAAVDRQGDVIGWVGGIPGYGGNVWELHPIVVHADWRGHGVGRALVEDLEAQVAARDGLTLWLGTDDEDAMTSLAGRDLFPNLLNNLASIRDVKRHPFGFYLKLGFSLAGVVPDANGPGKPDILMAKRVRRS